ncbi:uncharacterized protein LY79DRAFT_540829 [Colletotrichum navitas]|uniref:Uncharacterized protein n=1 Tax=Colletotrichum navitas TaxID=681940 RepID=A0AAD8Q842_9PEZI|nr:uncharacterized protein LY79DRAFT_540829 [Colletotrichum navitas]KAK1597705.1 hypothetical protein LY79DRAFT_540829 [Colletotrichum navitas]
MGRHFVISDSPCERRMMPPVLLHRQQGGLPTLTHYSAIYASSPWFEHEGSPRLSWSFHNHIPAVASRPSERHRTGPECVLCLDEYPGVDATDGRATKPNDDLAQIRLLYMKPRGPRPDDDDDDAYVMPLQDEEPIETSVVPGNDTESEMGGRAP